MAQKSKVTAGLLGIFLGFAGVHNFYLGNKSRGILHIVMYCIGLTGILVALIPYIGWILGPTIAFIFSSGSSIWGIVEGILILTGKTNTDANGNPLV